MCLQAKRAGACAAYLKPRLAACRNMDEMWDETDTERCRQQFIRGMYKFPKCPTVKLGNGKPMPVLGLGPWRTAEGGVQDIVEKALRSGVR